MLGIDVAGWHGEWLVLAVFFAIKEKGSAGSVPQKKSAHSTKEETQQDLQKGQGREGLRGWERPAPGRL